MNSQIMMSEFAKELPFYEIVAVNENNYQEYLVQLREIYETNSSFFLLTEGKIASEQSMINNIFSLPPNFDRANKFHLVLLENGLAVGLLDLLAGYPKEDFLWIGLLLINVHKQNKAIGSNIVTATLKAAQKSKFSLVRLGVIKQNIRGLRFWKKMGFVEIDKSDNIVILELQLS